MLLRKASKGVTKGKGEKIMGKIISSYATDRTKKIGLYSSQGKLLSKHVTFYLAQGARDRRVRKGKPGETFDIRGL